MGNSIAKKYSLSATHSATAGHLRLWKIYNGSRKDDILSVWTFDREALSSRGLDTGEQEQALRIMRSDVAAMRLFECDGLIKATDVLEEGKSIAFVSERILFSLADLMSRFSGYASNRYREYVNTELLTEIEISRGILSLIEGLQYLHTVQRKLHLHVSPENIVVTASSFQWKLCGFGLALSLQSDERALASPYFLKESNITNNKGVYFEPNLNYAAPEMTVHSAGSLRYLAPSSDVFSLGLVLYEVFHFINTAHDTTIKNIALFQIKNNSISAHQTQCMSIKSSMNTSGIPSSVVFLLEGTLQTDPNRRFSLTNLTNNAFFNSGQLSLLKALETIQVRDVGTQASFLSSLHAELASFPHRITEGTILPCLCRLGATNPNMWVYTLPLHVTIADQLSSEAYRAAVKDYVFIALKVDSLSEVTQSLLRHSTFFADKLSASLLAEPLAALFEHALDKHSGIQSLALQTLCDLRVSGVLTWESLTGKVLPKVCREACKNPDSEIKTTALAFIGQIVKRLDKEYIARNILPSLDYILQADKNPSVTAAVIGVYKLIVDVSSLQCLCKDVLPSLLPLLADRAISVRQYDMVIRFVAYLLNRVNIERSEQLNTSPIALSSITSFEDNLLDVFLPSKNVTKIDRSVRVPSSMPSMSMQQQSVVPHIVQSSPPFTASTNANDRLQNDISALASADIWSNNEPTYVSTYNSNGSGDYTSSSTSRYAPPQTSSSGGSWQMSPSSPATSFPSQTHTAPFDPYLNSMTFSTQSETDMNPFSSLQGLQGQAPSQTAFIQLARPSATSSMASAPDDDPFAFLK